MIIKPKSQSGQTLVEFALTLPLILLLVFGLIEFSLVLYDKAKVTKISREAARAGVVFRTDSNFNYSPKTSADIITEITDYIDSNLVSFGSTFNPQSNSNVILNWSSNYSDPLSYTRTSPPYDGTYYSHTGMEGLKVVVQYEYDFLVLRIFPGVPNSLSMRSVAIMKME